MEPWNRFQGMNSAILCSLAGRYDNPIPPQFLAPIDSLKIPALAPRPTSIHSFLGTPRDIQRLSMTPFSLVLRKEYFNCPKRDSHAVHHIKKRRDRGVCNLVYSVVSQLCDVLHRRLVADSDKIPEGGASTYILYLLGTSFTPGRQAQPASQIGPDRAHYLLCFSFGGAKDQDLAEISSTPSPLPG